MFKKLESLRGVAACLVVLFHSPFKFGATANPFIGNCYLLVDFFFVLSGFVMSHAYGARVRNGISLGDYLALRLGRLYPLHLFMLLVWVPFILAKQYLYLHGYGGSDQFAANNIGTFAANLLLLQAMHVSPSLNWNQPSWSISAEFYTYIVFFLSIWLIDRRRRLFTPLLIALAAYLFLFVYLRPRSLDITYDFGFIRCIGAFYLGVFVYRVRPWLLRVLDGRLLGLLEMLSIAALIASVTWSDARVYILLLSVVSFALVLLIFSAERSGACGRLLLTRGMLNLGLWSYSIYMTHRIFLFAASNVFEYVLHVDLDRALGLFSPLINGAIFVLVIGFSRFTYIHIESRFRDLVKERVNAHRRRRLPLQARTSED